MIEAYIPAIRKIAPSQKDAKIKFIRNSDGMTIREETYYGTKLLSAVTYMNNEEYDETNNLTFCYFGNNTARWNNEKNRIEYFHKDVLGSTVLITDTNGNKLERTAYDPFGSIEKQKTSTDNDKLFTGQRWNQKLGIYTYPYREYDWLTGRWMGRDRIIGSALYPQQLNRYLYCYNNPLIYFDKDGRMVDAATIRLTASGISGVLMALPTGVTQLIGGSVLAIVTAWIVADAIIGTVKSVESTQDESKSKPKADDTKVKTQEEKTFNDKDNKNDKPTNKQLDKFKKQLEEHGRKSVEKSKKSIEQNL
ncbi:MAG: RHS repeat-associated core domain-containing protein, partial [Patescibacteria group bacterium]